MMLLEILLVLEMDKFRQSYNKCPADVRRVIQSRFCLSCPVSLSVTAVPSSPIPAVR